MHTVPQNRDKFTTINLFYCCKPLIFTHALVYEFLCGPKHMATPVDREPFLISIICRSSSTHEKFFQIQFPKMNMIPLVINNIKMGSL